MASSIKFTDDIYLDSSDVTHKYNDFSMVTLDKFINESKTSNSKIMLRQTGQNYSLPSGAYIGWNEETFNNSNGLFTNMGNGLIEVNYTGYVKFSFGIWVGGNANYRPWLRIVNYTTGARIFDAIDDSSSNYVTVAGSNIIAPVTSGDRFGISIVANVTPVYINTGASTAMGTYFTIETI